MSSLDKRETGSIKWYNRTKGYGFITPDGCRGSADLFFHVTAIAPDWEPWYISPGDDVEYSTERDEVGRLRAVQVTRRKGTCLACGQGGHHVKDCKDTQPGQAVVCNRRGKWGHMARGWGRKCFDCGEMGHIAVHCPRRQASSSLDDSDVGDESGDGATGYDDDCVILEKNPFVRTKKPTEDWRKLIQNLIAEFCDISSDRICKREEGTDEEQSSYDCVLLENKQQEEESDDNCIVLDKNPFEEDVHETIINMSNKLSLSSDVRTTFSVQQPSDSKLQSLKEEGLDHDELLIVAEKGQVACRDYPHSRHLCVKYPFKDTPHHTYCNLCYCYVCDIKAPCKYWETENDGHCHASELEFKWIEMRVLNRTKCP